MGLVDHTPRAGEGPGLLRPGPRRRSDGRVDPDPAERSEAAGHGLTLSAPPLTFRGMPLTLVAAPTSRRLWTALVEGGLEEGAHLWLAHRNHRDLLFEAAHARGLEGWLDPPLTFLSDLPDRFGIATRPAGLLTRRRLLARCAALHGQRLGIGDGGRGHSVARGHMLDPLVGELLAAGVEPGPLKRALGAVADDDFARRRNAWIHGTYEDYRSALAERGLHDPREVPALAAGAVRDGRLSDVLGGARRLHVWGVLSLGTWGALVRALAVQEEVEVLLYRPEEDEPDPEWEALPALREHLKEDSQPPEPSVQPAPDAQRELRWVAGGVKELLASGICEPWEVAVVARSGEDDVRRAWVALREAGVPATARIRTPLHEVAALKLLLRLLRGAATGWPYRTLRDVLGSPYLDARVDLRFLDGVAARRRVEGLDAWREALSREARRLEREAGERDSEGLRALAEKASDSLERFRAFQAAVAPLSMPRPEAEWIDRTLQLLAGQGLLHFRRRLSRPVGERWDAVRLDQRGVLTIEALLREWRSIELDRRPLTPEEWHTLLRRLLEGHQLALTTPLQKGVQVLEAHDAALTPFRHVWLVHANDGVFPRVTSGGGVLTEGERARLAEASLLPLADRARALRRERTLWRAVVAAADVTITYRTTDPAGTPLLPSLMVPEHAADSELSRTWEPPVPLDEDQLHRSLAADLADARGDGAVTAPSPELLQRAVVGAHAEDARFALEAADTAEGPPLTPWAGWIRDPAALALLEARYGDEHVWSASQLEAYAACPWLFFVERVLRLEDVAEAEEETDILTFGGVAHRLLERFWKRMKDRPPPHWDLGVETEYAETRQEVLAALEAEEQWTGLPVLWRETWRDVSDAVRDYIRWELPKLAKSGDRPELVEYAFGRDAGPPVRVRGTDRGGRDASILLAGRIDRVDRLSAGGHAILDYKTSNVPAAKSYDDGVTLQSALYMTVVHETGGGPVRRAGYRSIRTPGKGSRGDIAWGSEEHLRAIAFALAIPERVRIGRFEPVQATSAGWKDWHPGRDVCRTRAALSAGTRWDDGGAP